MPLLTLSPFVVWMTVFLTAPLLLVLIVSFCQRSAYGEIQYVFTLANYSRMLDPLFLNIGWSSFIVSLATTVLCLVLGYPFAYFIARAPKRYRIFLLMLTIIPFWTNSLVRTYAWIMLLRTEGIINSYLLALGFVDKPLAMLYNQEAVLLGMVYTLFPFMVLPLYASIEKMDRTYLEAAADLGANPVYSFFKVTLPLTLPGIVAGSLLVFVPTLGYFFIPDLMGGSKIMLISNMIKNQFLTARDWPFGSALSIVLIVLTLALIALYMRVLRKEKDPEVF
ncbi:Spermidine/putrescine transport system permease protein PotB [Propionispora sp. 2/2-37]|uniref:ABC transporter permease n=1 Tax=Propionispora sp. 2/2-37 TaxID=1677858 RepID=UPI0006BB57F4|nr:ABC transporter permease [Propionispora sp. 2/2-37]CUH96260.1 Spermidine/putrescine transport system permease protein PotB [Propionispora sp. 2/2-37]